MDAPALLGSELKEESHGLHPCHKSEGVVEVDPLLQTIFFAFFIGTYPGKSTETNQIEIDSRTVTGRRQARTGAGPGRRCRTAGTTMAKMGVRDGNDQNGQRPELVEQVGDGREVANKWLA
jgi:hypothetical protein